MSDKELTEAKLKVEKYEFALTGIIELFASRGQWAAGDMAAIAAMAMDVGDVE